MPTETEKNIAQWMLKEFDRRNGYLRQVLVANHVRKEFGEEHVYRNRRRHWALNKGILDAFRELTPDDVVWSRSRQLWRKRQKFDPPTGRMVK